MERNVEGYTLQPIGISVMVV